MNIAIRWSVRKTKCRYCEEDVVKDTPLLVWTRKWKNHTWIFLHYYHPECWMAERMYYLNDRPKPVRTNGDGLGHGGGRPPLNTTEEEKKERKVRINRRNRLISGKYPFDEVKLGKIRARLMEIGGLPTSWG